MFEDELRDWHGLGLTRFLRRVQGTHGASICLDNQSVINFSSNNYNCLCDDAVLQQAAIQAIQEVGTGVGASRLVVGNNEWHHRLEQQIARFHQRPAALLFNSGYNANVGTIPALVGKGDVIYSDQLNHASIIDGCRLSGADIHIYSHGDTGNLHRLLEQNRGKYQRALVVTDAVFSMDGDCAPVRQLKALCDEYDAIFMVDEAHATGVLGPKRTGLCAMHQCIPDVHVGTLSKGVGSFGGYVTGDESLIQWLLQRARSFVFTTGLPVGVVAASCAALELLAGDQGDVRQKQLFRSIDYFARGLRRLHILAPGIGATPIFPILVESPQHVMECSERLLSRGIFVPGIRPPTVPRGTSRLRFTLMACHTRSQLDTALSVLESLVSDKLIPPVENP